MTENARSEKRTDAALLAPIPDLYLEPGAEIARRHGKVAFGSRAWELFNRLDELRDGKPVPVYIYASHAPSPIGPKVSWTGLYVGQLPSKAGAYPGNPAFRPPWTHEEDSSAYWVTFWHVAELEALPSDEWIRIGDILKYPSRRRYGNSFVPEGPIIVAQT